MIFKRILTACTILFLTMLHSFGQENKQKLSHYDIAGKQFKGLGRYDYFTEQGDTLKAVPYVGEYVECTIGRDSLKARMKEIYYRNHYKHNEYDYTNLRVYAYLLFDEELNIKEIRMTATRHEKGEADEFRLDLCNDLAELLKTTQWVKKADFPEPGPHSLMTVGFWNSYRYVEGDIQPY